MWKKKEFKGKMGGKYFLNYTPNKFNIYIYNIYI